MLSVSPALPHDSDDYFTFPPPPPDPSTDSALSLASHDDMTTPPSPPSPNSLDVSTLNAVTSLKLLCAGIEALVRVTGDVPPTPPCATPIQPHMRGMQAEKESISRSNSLSKMPAWQQPRPRAPSSASTSAASDDIDGVELKKTSSNTSSIGAEHHHSPYIVIGENAEPINIQHGAISRKFYSKKPPPIALEDYLMRIHTFCPMSTAVYLATSFYIHRLAVDERAIAVTRRNCHRLLLAGLRVAMKALEDLSYPHARFAKVGGVSEAELARLEISFCFLTNFEFRTDKATLLHHALDLREISSLAGSLNFVPQLPNRRSGKC